MSLSVCSFTPPDLQHCHLFHTVLSKICYFPKEEIIKAYINITFEHICFGNRKLTAFIEAVQPVNVILAHLRGLAKGNIAVGNGLHGGKVVL